MAAEAGFLTRSQAFGRAWRLVNRIAVEELEAWYFGDWAAVRAERVNDFAAPGVMNLLRRVAIVGRCFSSPLLAG